MEAGVGSWEGERFCDAWVFSSPYFLAGKRPPFSYTERERERRTFNAKKKTVLNKCKTSKRGTTSTWLVGLLLLR
jgi:hypothetical protein